jgi:hypothetical protein
VPWILLLNGLADEAVDPATQWLADRCRVPYSLETMSCIVGHIVMLDVMPRDRFYYRSIQHLGHIALGHLVTFSFWAGTAGT